MSKKKSHPLRTNSGWVKAISEELGVTQTRAREILDVMTRNTAKALDSGARINVPGVGRVEQYVRKAGPRWNPKTKTHFDAPAMVSLRIVKPAKKPVA